MEYYRYMITIIGPIYVFTEAAQSVGLSIIIGEKVANWLSGVTDDFANDLDDDRDRYNRICHCKEQIALGVVCIIYSISFWILYQVFMMESTNHWPLSVYYVIGWIVFGMILLFLTAWHCTSGTIVQTAMISLFLSYIIYSTSQTTIASIDIMTNTDTLSKNTTNFLLQCAVVLIILLSIPPTMHDLDEMEANKIKHSYETEEDFNDNKGRIKHIFGDSTRIQCLIMMILVLLLTHVFMLWINFKTLSVNLFWYRIAETALSIILYLFVMWKEENTANDNNLSNF
eukprot:867633_1